MIVLCIEIERFYANSFSFMCVTPRQTAMQNMPGMAVFEAPDLIIKEIASKKQMIPVTTYGTLNI